MKNWKYWKPHQIKTEYSKKKTYDDSIFTFDIETSSYLRADGIIYPASEYSRLKETGAEIEYLSSMYIWMFSVEDQVYYGRTWAELQMFLSKLDHYSSDWKIVYVHNLSFEFQFLQSHLEVKNVFARKSRKVIGFELEDYNFEFRCSLYLTNTKLAMLPKLYNLPVKKMEGDLDYSLLRNSETRLSRKELKYCENDCLVLYEAIKFFKKQYVHVFKIPKTSTGIVRKEFKDRVQDNDHYYKRVKKAYNSDPHIYTMLVRAFQGGYTHANVIYADEILRNVSSYDLVSSYPYHQLCRMYPATRFRKSNIKRAEEMLSGFAYLMKVKFYDLDSKYYNHFISLSKCYDYLDPVLDNGRIIRMKECTMYLTDVDLKLYLDCYNCSSYEILEVYSSIYKYLPIELVEFILDKYQAKTELRGVDPIAYALEKGKFNSVFGMSVTNTIRAEVEYSREEGWKEVPLTNEQIEKKLRKEFNYSFMSFSWGVWITSWARDTLIRQIMANDQFNAYSDTDSLKLIEGFDPAPIEQHNKRVLEEIMEICQARNLDPERFMPKDKKGIKHLIGIFDCETGDHPYEQFKTLGAKKYCYMDQGELHITVSGVPKSGAKCLSSINEFKKGLVFPHDVTNKLTLCYNDYMDSHTLIDYQGNPVFIEEGNSGVTMIGNDYTLRITEDYSDLIMSSQRAEYAEEEKLL